MTNFEKWKDEILGMLGGEFGVLAVANGKVERCEYLKCDECTFHGHENEALSCEELFIRWLYEEAEPDNKPEEPFEGIRSCENCIYDDRSENEKPCVECKEQYTLKFEPKPKEPELKPCPFCGHDGRVVADGEGNYMVQCNECSASTGWCVDKEEALEAWNRRKGE